MRLWCPKLRKCKVQLLFVPQAQVAGPSQRLLEEMPVTHMEVSEIRGTLLGSLFEGNPVPYFRRPPNLRPKN